MSGLTFNEVQTLVQENNRSEKLSDNFIICLIWKESNFKSDQRNAKSSATGLMQITKAVIKDVNTAFKTSFTHEDMTDPAKNIQCGSYYLDLRIRWAKDTKKGIEGYGTGSGYSNNIFACESCLKADKEHWSAALFKIHP